MTFHQFLPAFAMMETIRKGGTHWECLPSGFIVYKDDQLITYSFARLEVAKLVDVSTLDLDSNCAVLFFPNKRGNNILVLSTKYLKTLIEPEGMNLSKLDKNQILYADTYEIRKNDIRDECTGGVQERPRLDTQSCGDSQCI